MIKRDMTDAQKVKARRVFTVFFIAAYIAFVYFADCAWCRP